MSSTAMALQVALRGIAAAIAILFIVACFMAYLDPGVYLPALSVLSLCK